MVLLPQYPLRGEKSKAFIWMEQMEKPTWFWDKADLNLSRAQLSCLHLPIRWCSFAASSQVLSLIWQKLTWSEQGNQCKDQPPCKEGSRTGIGHSGEQDSPFGSSPDFQGFTQETRSQIVLALPVQLVSHAAPLSALSSEVGTSAVSPCVHRGPKDPDLGVGGAFVPIVGQIRAVGSQVLELVPFKQAGPLQSTFWELSLQKLALGY